MKNNIFKLIIAAALVALLSITSLCIFVFAESGDSELDISYSNLSFENEIHLLYAIKSNDENVKLLVWKNPQDEYILGTQDVILSPAKRNYDIRGALYTIFEYDGLSAKQMADNVYVRAYIDNGESVSYGEVDKYSILMYAYSKLGKTGETSTNENLRTMLQSMLEYGANAQKYFDYKTDRLANDNWVQIKLDGGNFDHDGSSIGLYLLGDELAISANGYENDGTTEGEAFHYWKNGSDIVSSSGRYTFTVEGSDNVTFTAYEAVYSIGLSYTSNGDGTCSVSGIGTCTDTELYIPPVSPEGDRVTKISDSAFQSKEALTYVMMPNGIASIGSYAFADCNNVVCFGMPKSMTKIGDSAFSGCSKLTTINIPNNVINIGDATFSGCSSLRTIKIPTEITHISDSMFKRCTNLTNIEIPAGVKSIGKFAFQFCSGLTGSVIIPNEVTNIGNYAFYGCSNLTNIDISDNVKSIGEAAFYGCNSLKSIEIPLGVSTIESSTFYGCSSLTSIEIPSSVISIKGSAFAGCSTLSHIYIHEGVNEICDAAFYRCNSLITIDLPSSITFIGNNVFYGCSSITTITIPTNVTNIGSSVFVGCNSLENITVEEGNMVYHSEGNCLIETTSKRLIAGIHSSVIPTDGSIISIGTDAFYDCKKLTDIEIPNGVTSIGNSAFNNCSNLVSIIIPDDVTSIEYAAFYNCGNLIKIIFNGTIEQWNNITKGSRWNTNTGEYTIYCTDGNISK